MKRGKRWIGWLLFAVGLLLLVGLVVVLRLSLVTDHLYHQLIKDPPREIATGPVLVAPADGTVMYIRKVTDGVVPEVIKKGVAVPIVDHIKAPPLRPFESGYLVGIYMNTQGVHLNRTPSGGTIRQQIIFNGPHMDMTDAESEIMLRQLIPGRVTFRKWLGMEPFDLENRADFVLNSARETLVLEDERGKLIYIVRIADYYVGKILTWVDVGQTVERGQKLGMITWGSQTDLFIEDSEGLEIVVKPGDYLYAGETVVASY